MKELYEQILKVANQFYIGNDSEGWTDFAAMVTDLLELLSKCSSDEDMRILQSVILELENVEMLKGNNNILAIADFLLGSVSVKLKDYLEVN